jgi:hypothetical protein
MWAVEEEVLEVLEVRGGRVWYLLEKHRLGGPSGM